MFGMLLYGEAFLHMDLKFDFITFFSKLLYFAVTEM